MQCKGDPMRKSRLTELTETLFHMSGYVGVPLVREATFVARKVFAEVRAENA